MTYDIVVRIHDTYIQVCIRHADCILILARADKPPNVTSFEEKMETMSLRTTKVRGSSNLLIVPNVVTIHVQQELVLLHTEDTKIPTRTAKWLENRSWVSTHYHIKIPNKMLAKR